MNKGKSDGSKQLPSWFDANRNASDVDKKRSLAPSASPMVLEHAMNFDPPSEGPIASQHQQAAGLLPMATSQLATHSYLPRAQVLPSMSSLDLSLLNQLSYVPPALMAGLTHVRQAPPPLSSLQLNQLQQLAPLTHNVARLQLRHVISPQAPMPVSSRPQSFLDLLAAAQTSNHSYLPPTQSTSALADAYLLQQLSASRRPLWQVSASQNQNPSSLLPIVPQDQSQLRQSLIQEIYAKDQIIDLLLANDDINITPRMATSTNHQMEFLLQVMSANAASNAGTTNQVTMPVAAAAAAAAAAVSTASSSYTYPKQSEESDSFASGAAKPKIDSELSSEVYADKLASQGHLRVPSQSKEKRWMMRYGELIQFHQKHGHCRVPHGYAENRKLSWWVMNQRAQYQLLRQGKKSWLSEDHAELLDAAGFDWNPVIGKSCKG